MTPEPEPPKVETWTDANGKTHTLETYRGPNESLSEWQERHDEAVTFWKGIFPEA